LAPMVDAQLSGYADSLPEVGATYHLALWHGLEPALLISVLAILGGLGLHVLVRRANLDHGRTPGTMTAALAYRSVVSGLDVVAARVTSVTQRGSLPYYLGVILVVLMVPVGTGLV